MAFAKIIPGGKPWVSVAFWGKHGRTWNVKALVDITCSRSFIQSSFAEKVGLTPSESNPDGSVLSSKSELFIQGEGADWLKFVDVDLEWHKNRFPEGVGLLIGKNIINDFTSLTYFSEEGICVLAYSRKLFVKEERVFSHGSPQENPSPSNT